MRKTKLAGAIALSLLSLNVYALSLGNMNIDSHLGEPLDVSININSISEDEYSTLKVSLATREMFSMAGIEYPANADKLHIELGPYKSGNASIRVRTPGSIIEPFVHLLLDINWSGGNILREYTALIDPADYKPDPVTQAVLPATTLGVSAANSSAQSNAPATTGSGELYHQVKSGDSLSAIAALHRPANVGIQQAWIAFYRLNQDAFLNNNINSLEKGYRLQIPTAEQMLEVSQSEAIKEVAQLSKALPPAKAEQPAAPQEKVAESAPPPTPVTEPKPAPSATLVVGGSAPAIPGEDAAVKQAPQAVDGDAGMTSEGYNQLATLANRFGEFTQVVEQEINESRNRDTQFREELIATRGENRVLSDRMSQLETQINRLTELLELQGNALQAITSSAVQGGTVAPVVPAPPVVETVPEQQPVEITVLPEPTATEAPAPTTAAPEPVEPAQEGDSYYSQLVGQALTDAPEEDKSYIEQVMDEASTSIGLPDTNPVTPEMEAKATASKPATPAANQETEDMLASVRASLGLAPSEGADSQGLQLPDAEIADQDLAYIDALNEEDRSLIQKSEERIAELERQLQEKIKAAQEASVPDQQIASVEPTSVTEESAGETAVAPQTSPPPATTETPPAQTQTTTGSSEATTAIQPASQQQGIIDQVKGAMSGVSSDMWRLIGALGAMVIGFMVLLGIRRNKVQAPVPQPEPEEPSVSIALDDPDEPGQDVADLATQSMADPGIEDMEEELHGSSLFDLSDESFMASEAIQDDSSLFAMDEEAEESDSLADMDSVQLDQQSTMTQAMDVDPIAEADVYLAYDRKEQAIEVLEQAIDKDPDQSAAVIKLLGLYQAEGEIEKFSKLFESSAEHIEDDEVWNSIKSMAQDFVPGHQMLSDDFDSSIPVLSEEVEEKAPEIDLTEEVLPDALASMDDLVLEQELDEATEEINQHEPDTALALAKAYIELGEEDIAKDFLNDVISAENTDLKSEAEELLSSLG